jgi:hypothetical protein
METGTWHGQLTHSQRKRRANRLPSLHPGRHSLTLPPDLAIGDEFNCSKPEKVTDGDDHTPDPPSK